MARRLAGRRKRSSRANSVSRAKKDAQSFARSIGGFIPGIGTILGIESVYRDGKKLMDSGPKALKSMFSIKIGTKRSKRRSKRSKR